MAPANSFRDRTSEFAAVVERLQRQLGAPQPSTSGTNGGFEEAPFGAAKSSVARQSEFARRASQIGLAIHRTSAKLQKLAQLAKRTSMFDDPSQEIDELTGVVKQDIQALNLAIAELQKVSGRGEESKQSAEHSHTVVDSLRTRLKDTTAEFKQVLTLRTESLKAHSDRRRLFSAAPSDSAAAPLLRPRRALTDGANGSAGPHGPARSAADLFSSPPPGGAAGGMLLQQQQLQQQDSYLASRQQALHSVESTIVELGSIFQQLAHLVAEQGEMAQRIDENVEEAVTNVDNAKAQLLKYLNGISSNRWLVMKVFGVLLVFLVLFIFLM